MIWLYAKFMVGINVQASNACVVTWYKHPNALDGFWVVFVNWVPLKMVNSDFNSLDKFDVYVVH